MEIGEQCLIHAENGGRPHCIAARRDDSRVTIWDEDRERIIQYNTLMACFMDRTDKSSVVIVTLQPPAGDQANTVHGNALGLLQLRAGAGVRMRVSTKTRDVGTLWQEPDVMATLALEVDSMKKTLRSQLAMGKSEVQAVGKVLNCPFCPFRTFAKTRRTLAHIESQHTEGNRFCPSGGKQFRVV